MKAILEFDLPEDDWALKAAEQGQDCRHVLQEIAKYLRSEIKYGVDPSPDKIVTLEEVQEKFFNALSDYGIDIDAD